MEEVLAAVTQQRLQGMLRRTGTWREQSKC